MRASDLNQISMLGTVTQVLGLGRRGCRLDDNVFEGNKVSKCSFNLSDRRLGAMMGLLRTFSFHKSLEIFSIAGRLPDS